MKLTLDVVASLAMGVCCVTLLLAHRLAGAPQGFRRVQQQGASVFLGFDLMNAGYWMLQPVVKRCLQFGVSPAAISWLSLGPALVAAVAVARGHWGMAAWALLVSALLDVLDGAVARAAQHSSPAGAVLDSVLDRYAEFIFFTGVFIFYETLLAAQLVVLCALLGSFLVTYSTAKAEAMTVTPPRGTMKRSDRLTVLIVGAALTPLFSMMWEPATTQIAWPALVSFGLIAVLANVSAVRRFLALAHAAGGS